MPRVKARFPLYWLLIPVLLLLAALVIRNLDADLLWIDELYSVGNIGAVYRVPFSPAQVWESVQQNSPQHTPGYFFLLSGWAWLVGWSPFALRALSLFFSLLAVVWTYRVGRDWISPHAGLYAALVLGMGAFFVHFSHEIRMYTLIAALTIFVLWQYRRIITPQHRPALWEWLLLFVGGLGLIYSHVIGAIPLAAVGLYHLLFVPKNRRWLVVVAVFALVGLLFLPWVGVILSGAEYGSRGDAALQPLQFFPATFYLFSSGNPLELLLLIGLAVVALAVHKRRAWELWFFLVAMFVLTVAMNEVTNIITPNRTRYLIPMWPVLALLVGLGLSVAERRRWLLPVFLLVWVIVGVWNTLDQDFLGWMDGPRHVVDFPPLEEMVEEVNELAEPADFLVTFARHQHVFERFKFVSIGEYYFHDLDVNSFRVTLPDPRPVADIRRDMLAAVGKRLTVWFAYEPEIDAAMLQVYRQVLEENYRLCGSAFDSPDLRIERYDYASFACLDQPETAPVLRYDAGVTLADVRVEAGADNVLRVAAGWDVAETVPPNTYSVSLKLHPVGDSSGAFVGQADYGLRSVGFGWQLAELPLTDVPPGDYTLMATVYDWRLGPRLLATGADGAQGEELPVAQITIPDGASP